MRFCDYCGSELAEQGESIAFGHSQGQLRSCTADEWFYYCEGECSGYIKEMLTNIARFANLKDGDGLHWKLVELPEAEVIAEPGGEVEEELPPDPVERPERLVKAFGRQKLHENETADSLGPDVPLHTIGLRPRAVHVLCVEDLMTLADVARVSESELRMIEGVGPHAIARLKGSLKKAGLEFAPDRFDLEASAEQLRVRRLSVGLSQCELSREIDPTYQEVTQATISGWENGTQIVPAKWRESIAKALGLDPAAILLPVETP